MSGDLQTQANALLGMPGAALWVWMGSRAASVALGVLALGLGLASETRRRLLLPAILAVVLADLSVNRVLKPAFDEARPCAVRLDLATGLPGDPRHCSSSGAFPSSHAANTAALAVALASRPLLAVSAIVGVQRVVTAQHSPLDVLAGWFWGAVLGLGCRRVADALWRRRERRIMRTGETRVR